METKANYIVIGAFVFIVSTAAVVFGLWAAKFSVDTAWNRYEILFRESVIGLSSGSSVLYNGVGVGRVTGLKLNPDDPREVIATVEVQSDVPVKRDTRASIRLTGLTGTAAIQFSGGSPESPLLVPTDGDLPQIEAEPSPLAKLIDSSEGIVVTSNRFLARLDQLFSDDNIARLERTIASIDELTGALAKPDSDLNRMLADSARAAAALSETIARVGAAGEHVGRLADGVQRDLIAHLPELRASLGHTLDNIESLSARVDRIVAANEDSLSRIGSVSLRQVDGGLEELRGLIRDLSTTLRRLENNPSGFLFGGEQLEEYQP